ncbi:MAG: GAF domain-containing protein [Anaerolineae bacterium]|nr:GAF domain-containing protein [Anaerolineae bacterium]
MLKDTSADEPVASIPADVFQLDLRETLDKMAAGVMAALQAGRVFVYLAHSDGEFFLPFIASGELNPAERQIFENQQLHFSSDVLAYEVLHNHRTLTTYNAISDRRLSPSILSQLKIRSAVVLPLVKNDMALGMMIVDRPLEGFGFTREHVKLAEAIANAAALALDNVRLYQEASQRLLESQSLHQITLALLQKLELEEVLEIVCNEARRLTGSAGSSVSLIEDEHWLRIRYLVGSGTYTQGRFPVNDSLLGLAVRRGEAILINNPSTGQPGERMDEVISLLAVPLKVGGSIIGVLDVINKQPGFAQSDVRLMGLYADQAAVAIEHARLSRATAEMSVLVERQRLARELHDSVNQSLYGISLHAEVASRQLKNGRLDAVASNLDTLRSIVKDALGEMRLLIFGLRPSVLEQKGLVEAIETRIKMVEERAGLQTGFKARISGKLSEKVEESIYGIVQEALNNVVKHAHAAHVVVHLVQIGDNLIMKVEDDGDGFDINRIAEGGVGFKTMQERAAMIGARLSFISQPGQGTTVTVEAKL